MKQKRTGSEPTAADTIKNALPRGACLFLPRLSAIGLSLLIVLLRTPLASAWGPRGHQIVALIAEHDLTPEARSEVKTLLGPDSMADVSNWADAVRKLQPQTGPWHWVNLPPGASGYVRERDCPNGECVVGVIEKFAAILADSAASREQRRDALMFLIHFVGDVHQPMHCGQPADRGGTDIHLECFGKPVNLHELWDHTLIERQKQTPRQYADELLYEISDCDRTGWLRSPPADWATESWLLNQSYGYRSPLGRPLLSGDHVGRTYLDGAQAIADQRLARAGVRLAGMINDAIAKHRGRPATAPASQPTTAGE